MSLEIGARYPHRLAGIVGISGYVHEPEKLALELSPQAREQRFLMTHGTQDPLIPIEQVRPQIELLTRAGLRIQWREFAKAAYHRRRTGNGGHPRFCSGMLCGCSWTRRILSGLRSRGWSCWRFFSAGRRWASSITGFSPSFGQPGNVINIFGSGLTGATLVEFNNNSPTPADFIVLSDSQLQVVVPMGATTGPLEVFVGSAGVTSAAELPGGAAGHQFFAAKRHLADAGGDLRGQFQRRRNDGCFQRHQRLGQRHLHCLDGSGGGGSPRRGHRADHGHHQRRNQCQHEYFHGAGRCRPSPAFRRRWPPTAPTWSFPAAISFRRRPSSSMARPQPPR